MKIENLKLILETLKKGNPRNISLNHRGLNELGKILFYPNKSQEKKRDEYVSLIENYYEDGGKKMLASLRTYHFSSFYTDKSIINEQLKYFTDNNIQPKTILEPSAGNGAYVIEMAKKFPNAGIIALEPDVLSFTTLQSSTQIYPNVECINIRFEDYYLETNQKFDLVMSNIPFGSLAIENAYKHTQLKNSSEKLVNVFFNKYCLELLTEKGYAFILTSKQFADNSSYQKIRNEIVQKNDLVGMFRFNNALFKNEQTEVVTDLLIYQNNPFKTSLLPSEELFGKSDTISIQPSKNPTKSIEFEINSYLNSTIVSNINGLLDVNQFHQRNDLTVIPLETSNDLFLRTSIESLVTDISLDRTPDFTKEIEVINPEQVKIVEPIKIDPIILTPIESISIDAPTRPIDTTTNEKKIITLNDLDYLENQTQFYTNTFHYRNNAIYFHESKDTFKKQQIFTKNYDLFTVYIELKNNFFIFNENVKNDVYDKATLISKFNDLEWLYSAFTLRYDSLDTHNALLRNDNLYNVLVSKFESFNEKKQIIQNPLFNVETYLSFITPKEPQIIQTKSKTTQSKTTLVTEPKGKEAKIVVNSFLSIDPIAKFETPTFDPKDELKINAYKYYDNYGTIDITFLADLYQEENKKIVEKGLEQQLFFYNPIYDANEKFKRYQIDLFPIILSDSIDRKIETYLKNELPLGLDNSKIIQELNQVKNEKLDIKEIEFNFESNFISNETKSLFFKDLIGEKITVLSGQFDSTITLMYQEKMNTRAHAMYSVEPNQTTGVKGSFSYKSLFECFSTNKFPTVTYSIEDSAGNKITKVDEKGTLSAINKYEQIHLEFKSFIYNDEKLKQEVENNYYDLFLSDKVLKIGSEFIKAPASFSKNPYEHQLAGVGFALAKGTALIDHTVGQGKTLTMSLLAYKLLQHKRAERIMITTEKSVASDFYKAIVESFPTLNVIRLDSKTNFTKAKRQETLEKIKNSTIDIIIAESSHIQYIPKDIEVLQKVFEKNINMIDQDLEVAKLYGSVQKDTKKIIEGLEKRKNTLKEKLNQRIEEQQKKFGDNLTFEALKIDALIIDEAHKFKNIQYTTRHQGVGGLNNSSISKKNFDLEVTIQSIHDRRGYDKNIFLFSGTPIINSVTELYAYQRYLTPNYLERKNIYNFDAWASNFVKQSIQAESDLFGNSKMHCRFRYFTNVPELSKMYHSFTHISDENNFNTHDVKVKEEFKVLESCPEYDELKKLSIDFAKNKNQEGLFGYEKYDKAAMQASFVTALTINRKALIDPLSIGDVNIEFDETHQYKIRTLIDDALLFNKQTEKDKGVVLIFTDLNSWKSDSYNSCTAIQNILINEHGINPSEIGIAQQYIAKNKNDEFQAKIRSGEIRFAIGSTASMGQGTNIQDKVIAVLSLDIPYTPHANIQRKGRMCRAGNTITEKYDGVGHFISYGIKDTTDIFSYSLNKHKELFIKQIKSEIQTLRTFDDVFTDINNVSAAQKEAMLIGDIESYSLVKLEDDYKQIFLQKQLYDINKNNASIKIDRFENDNKEIISVINSYQIVNETIQPLLPQFDFEDTPKMKEERVKDLFISLLDHPASIYKNSFTHYTYEDLAKYIESSIGLMYDNQKEKELFRFELNDTTKITYIYNKIAKPSTSGASNAYYFSINIRERNNTLTLKGQARLKFDMKQTPNHLNNILKSLPIKIKDLSYDLNLNLKSIASNKNVLTAQFPADKIEQLTTLKKTIKETKRNINNRNKL